jgi:hypothetical protein
MDVERHLSGMMKKIEALEANIRTRLLLAEARSAGSRDKYLSRNRKVSAVGEFSNFKMPI